MERRLVRILAGASLAIGIAVVSVARADDQAQTLFAQGRALMDAGRFAEACPKLAEAARLSPSGKYTLNLADCYEKNGQTASAYARYIEAADLAVSAHRRD